MPSECPKCGNVYGTICFNCKRTSDIILEDARQYFEKDELRDGLKAVLKVHKKTIKPEEKKDHCAQARRDHEAREEFDSLYGTIEESIKALKVEYPNASEERRHEIRDWLNKAVSLLEASKPVSS